MMDPFSNQYQPSLTPQPTRTAGCSPMLGCVLVVGVLVLGAAGAVLFLLQSSKSPVAPDAVSKLKEKIEDMKLPESVQPKESAPSLTAEQLYAAGAKAMEMGELDVALAAFDQSLAADPTYGSSYVMRGSLHYQKGNLAQALADYEMGVSLLPEDALANNNYAWFLATCPEDGLRDGKRAVELATKACELSEWKDAGFVDTLAAAYAENGRFKEAVKTQKKALQLLGEQGDPAMRKGFQERLELYQSKKAYREKIGG